ncbi:MAG: Ig-like domain-containing protein, partial [Thermoanaerobaculia bacterium]|nr:Ig-like domain-containing protein [Thermoanaerobaculia bacterium]
MSVRLNNLPTNPPTNLPTHLRLSRAVLLSCCWLLCLAAAFATPCLAAPAFVDLTPVDGSLLGSGDGQMTGRATGATALSIDGESVALADDGSFSSAFSLADGTRTFALVATDGSGATAELSHTLVVDTQPPVLQVTSPSNLVVTASPVVFAGVYQEPHLQAIVVDGVVGAGIPATAADGSWTASVPLVEGVNTIHVTATDSLGHSTATTLAVRLDSQAPVIAITESGSVFTGGLINRPVALEVAFSDATQLVTEVRLDGSPFQSGQSVVTEGSHVLEAVATDQGGLTTSIDVPFEIDLTAPVIHSILPASQSVLGDASVVLQVTTAGASAVRVTDSHGTVDGVGSGDVFSVSGATLVEGPQTLRIEALDSAGNVSERDHSLVLDTEAPMLVIDSPRSGDVVATPSLEVVGLATDPHLVDVRVEGQLANLVGPYFSGVSVTLAEGTNTLAVEATDVAGNRRTEQIMVELDSSAPTFQVTVGGEVLVSGRSFAGPVTPVIEVSDPTATVTATLDGAVFTSGTEVSSAGSHELGVTVTSAAGQSSSQLLIFTIDSQAPSLTVVSPAAGTVSQSAEVTLRGTADGARWVRVSGPGLTSDLATLYAGDWSLGPVTLVEGANTFTVVAEAANGLSSEQVHSLELDTTIPTLSIASPAAGALVGDLSLTVSGSASDSNLARVTVNGAEATLTGASGQTRTWLIHQVAVQEGPQTLQIHAEDTAGHRAERTLELVVDTTAPTLQITEPAPGTVVPDARYTIRGEAEDAHLDRVRVAGLPATVSASVGTRSTWSKEVDLEEGSNTIEVEAIDRLGLRATTSIVIQRDGAAPQVAIVEPPEGSYTNALTTTVRGTTVDTPDVTVKVNGQEALIDQGSWSVSELPLVEGVNRLVARAEDSLSNQGVHVREIVVDTVAPSLLQVEPASGALALPVLSSFRLRLSEPPGPTAEDPVTGGWRLIADGGATLAATASREGDELVIMPGGPLPSDAAIALHLTTELQDRAGNGLANPTVLSFHTVDTGAPATPQLSSAPPARLCATDVALEGVTEPGATVRVSGGAGAAEVRASDVDGGFQLLVALQPNRLNALELVALDALGNASAPRRVDVVHDCDGPAVLSAELDTTVQPATLTLTFDEAMAESTLAGAISLEHDGTPMAFTASASDASLSLDLASVPTGVLVLDVATTAHDLAGNALAYPYRKVFGGALGESFLSGTVLDAATGRPLVGAVAQVTATDGVSLPDPVPQQTVGAEGRFQIGLTAGTHDLMVARPGYVPVFRTVTTRVGEGTNVFDPRLQPASPTESIAPSGGTLNSSPAAAFADEGVASLALPSGALASAASASLTVVGEQALPALLPYGWSPRGAVWLDLDQDLLQPAILEIPVESPAGSVLPVVRLELATLQWQVLDLATVESSGGQHFASVSIDDWGGYVVVEADSAADVGAQAPTPAVVGQNLGSSAAPVAGAVTAASISFDPEVVLPNQRSQADVTYTLASAAPDAVVSGVPLTLWIREELELLDGTVRRQAPYPADLVLYRSPSGDARSRFWLEPSETAQRLTLRAGEESVTVHPYGEETVRGDVLGPAGGSLSNVDGDRVDIPSGALAEPTAVALIRRSEQDAPLAAPSGAPSTTVLGALELDMGGRELLTAAELTLVPTSPPAAGASGLLLHATTLDGDPIWRVVAQLEPEGGVWTTAAIAPADLAWPGVRQGGFYLFVELNEPVSYLRGVITDIDGIEPLVGAVIASPSVPWIQLSDAQGRYVLPLPLSPEAQVINITNPADGNQVSLTVVAATPDGRVDQDAAVQITGAQVLEVVPADGAVGVPAGFEPTVRFSEPVERGSLSAGLLLFQDETAVAIDLEHQGNLVRVIPRASLLPGHSYELRITSAIQDLQGHPLATPMAVTFRTQSAEESSGGLDRDGVVLYAPDSNNLARVVGAAGTVAGGSLVYVENQTSLVATESVTAAQDGSFEIWVQSTLDDTLVLHVLVEGSSEQLMVLGPFMDTSRKRAWIRTDRPYALETSEGVQILVEEGGFDRPTWVGLELTDPDTPAAAVPADLETVYAFELDFGGAEALKPLQLRLPAPSEATGEVLLLNRLVEVAGRPAWMMMDLLGRNGDWLTTENPESLQEPSLGSSSQASLKR